MADTFDRFAIMFAAVAVGVLVFSRQKCVSNDKEVNVHDRKTGDTSHQRNLDQPTTGEIAEKIGQVVGAIPKEVVEFAGDVGLDPVPTTLDNAIINSFKFMGIV